MRLAELTIHQSEFSFSAGHFTIFSATEREQLHGHNYNVSVIFKMLIQENGLSFDYRYYKKDIQNLCAKLDRKFLLPAQSPYLKLEQTNDYCIAHFNQKKLPFLHEDVTLLPLSNITIEELSYWFLSELLKQEHVLTQHGIQSIDIKVFNGPGQSGGALWEKK